MPMQTEPPDPSSQPRQPIGARWWLAALAASVAGVMCGSDKWLALWMLMSAGPWLVLYAAHMHPVLGNTVSVSRRGVLIGYALRCTPWTEIIEVREEPGGVALETAQGVRHLPACSLQLGRLLSEARRRLQPPADPPPAADAAGIEARLGVASGACRTVPGALSHFVVVRRAVLAGCGAVLALLCLDYRWRLDARSLAFNVACVALLVAVWGVLPLVGRRTLVCDGLGLTITSRIGRPKCLRWDDVVALREEHGGYVLVTSVGDIMVDSGADGAAELKRTVEYVFSTRTEAPGWAPTPGEASLSPAERLTGEQKRGLSQTDASQTGGASQWQLDQDQQRSG
ncbi:MAG: hypothetical protein HZB16_21525 [Armatimonadetes bacterium]|nr:hypothetical protein [Armatimonadota bacterium]